MSSKPFPLVSVVTVVFNAEEILRETIESVINQSYPRLEYIIIDGGSTDRTVDIIKEYDDRISYWCSEQDSGIYNAMNKALGIYSGDYVNFLNAGDRYCDPGVITSLFKSVSREVDIVYGDHIAISENRQRYRESFLLSRNNLIKQGTRVVNHQSMFVNRRVVVDYSEEYVIKGDFKWYLDMFRRTPEMRVLQCHVPVVYYDKHGISEREKMRNLKEFVHVIYQEAGVRGLVGSYLVIVKGLIQIVLCR